MPLAWLCAQDGAGRLLARSRNPWRLPSFEYRATHHVLALTLLFTCPPDAMPALGGEDAGMMRTLVSDDVEWALWCYTTLATGAGGLSSPDRIAADGAFRWLTSSRLLGGALDEELETWTDTATRLGAGVGVGVLLARRALGS
ncbi:hypothetical protein [Streptomyces violaceorubidus]|uniref:Uncharacterized protein n=1 Tax=Streptomyces violaceorubidus TaxID=284042 RepID=A0ABV1T272_9ACTN